MFVVFLQFLFNIGLRFSMISIAVVKSYFLCVLILTILILYPIWVWNCIHKRTSESIRFSHPWKLYQKLLFSLNLCSPLKLFTVNFQWSEIDLLWMKDSEWKTWKKLDEQFETYGRMVKMWWTAGSCSCLLTSMKDTHCAANGSTHVT